MSVLPLLSCHGQATSAAKADQILEEQCTSVSSDLTANRWHGPTLRGQNFDVSLSKWSPLGQNVTRMPAFLFCFVCQCPMQMQEVQRPTVLASNMQQLLSLVHQIAPLTGLQASVLLCEALLTCTCSSTPAQTQQSGREEQQQQLHKASLQQQFASGQQQNKPPEATASVPVIASVVEWYMSTVVKDLRNLGVSVSRARCRTTYFVHFLPQNLLLSMQTQALQT